MLGQTNFPNLHFLQASCVERGTVIVVDSAASAHPSLQNEAILVSADMDQSGLGCATMKTMNAYSQVWCD